MSTNGNRPIRGRQRILYAEELWRWQRFYAGLLVVVGILAIGVVVYGVYAAMGNNIGSLANGIDSA